MVENSEKTTRRGNNGNGFKPGRSGNPGGRPKITDQQRNTLQAIHELAPDAAQELSSILHGEAVSPAVKLKAIELILERTYGKAESTVNVNDPQRDSLDDLREEVRRIKADAECKKPDHKLKKG